MMDRRLVVSMLVVSVVAAGCGTTSEIRYPNSDWNIIMLDGTRSVAGSLDSLIDGRLYTTHRTERRSFAADSIAEVGKTRDAHEAAGALIGGVVGLGVGLVVRDSDHRKRDFDILKADQWFVPVVGTAVGATVGYQIGTSVGGTERHNCRSWHPNSREMMFKRLTGQKF